MKCLLKMTMVVALLTLMAGCCACRKGKNNVALQGTQWQLVRMMGRDLTFDNDKFVFTFTDGEFAGMGACNRMMGQYVTSLTGAMTFKGLASTRMMCPDLALETEFAQILERATHYEIDGDMLLILSNGEMQAVLHAINAK
ncbi:MAG: META domain-containing protein [Alistipes sp.]|nr:META domain-containing protein [Alistipes sp.]